MSRQNYYARKRRRKKRAVKEDVILSLVREERRLQPRLGGRKLLVRIRPRLEAAGAEVGRDRFFAFLRDHDLLVKPKPKKPKTTQSRHSLPVYGNRAVETETSGPHQVWVADITYVRTEEGFVYASVIMDRHTRVIVGAHMGDTLETAGCLAALEKALKTLPKGASPLHHSDRGCQYCSHAYVERLHEKGLSVSMTEVFHCYENAHAERVIGTLKQEYELDAIFRTKADAEKAFYQAVYLYNHCRPHRSLGYRTPMEVHQAGGGGKKAAA